MPAWLSGPGRCGDGRAPAIVLVDPKFPHNVGVAVRAASCYGLGQVWFTGDRVHLACERRFRLPREERMRGYQDVEVRHGDQPFDAFDAAVHAVYVFGARRTAHSTVRCSGCATGSWSSQPDTAPTWPPPSTPCSTTGTPNGSSLAWRTRTPLPGGGFDEPDHMAESVGLR
jgi:hypothetical protein